MSLNEITTWAFTVLTLIFVLYGFIILVRIAGRLTRALDLYITGKEIEIESSKRESGGK